jgi:hypothetical protein
MRAFYRITGRVALARPASRAEGTGRSPVRCARLDPLVKLGLDWRA